MQRVREKLAFRTTTLFPGLIDFHNPHFTTQLITYIGNKRSLLPFINRGIERVKKELAKRELVILDGFSGSGAVARLLKYHAAQLWVNDTEDYCEILNKCYLANRSSVDTNYIASRIAWLNEKRLRRYRVAGFIERNYAPRDDNNVQPDERVFYTNRNARIIDNLRGLIHERTPENVRHFFLAPLIVKASIHANTSGVFKGFHKNNGVGHFGGRGEDALERIKGEVVLDLPIFSDAECDVRIRKEDINELTKDRKLPELDLAYYDPPYNQHPYGSNYFMLNIIANEKNPEIQDGISGIVKDWNRSEYNKRGRAEHAMDELISNTPAKYIILSYNNEGIITSSALKTMLGKYGEVDVMKHPYNTYRGSRNLRNRSIKVEELLWILKRN